MRNIFLYYLIMLGVTAFSQGNTPILLDYQIKLIDDNYEAISFNNSNFDENFTPYFSKTIQNGNFSFKLENQVFSNCSQKEIELLKFDQISDSIVYRQYNSIHSSIKSSTFEFYPFVKRNGTLLKLISFSLKSKESTSTIVKLRKSETVTISKLSQNNWYKFSLPNKGIYKLTYEQLDSLGILSQPIPSQHVQLLSNHAKMLPFINQEDRMEDLKEIPLKMYDDNDGTFNEGDYFIFYGIAEGVDFYDNTVQLIKNEINQYSDSNYVFLNTNAINGKRIPTYNSNSSAVDTIRNYTKMTHHELEVTNFIKSGKTWVGEQFENNTLNFKIDYTPPVNEERKISSYYKVCSRSANYTDNIVSFIINKDTVSKTQLNKVSTIYYNDFVKFASSQSLDTLNQDSLNVSFSYHQTANPNVWLDYFILNTLEQLKYKGGFSFIEKDTDFQTHSYSIYSTDSLQVWDVTNFDDVKNLNINHSGLNQAFSSIQDTVREYFIFTADDYKSPIFNEVTTAQNLHGATSSNYIIITVPKFKEQAERLLSLHKDKDNLSGQIFYTQEIFNEYSSGRHEATAIRDFIKSIYLKGLSTTDSLQYVLLMGDGSYDHKNRLPNNNNLIPTFQSDNSVKLTSSYVTDDIYGLLDPHEGQYNAGDQLDISIGRLPVYQVNTAKQIVDKIYEYYNQYDKSNVYNDIEKSLLTSNGSWKNNILFIADDEDNNEHMKQADKLAELVDTTINELNIKKLLLDSYAQESSISGHTSPEANKALMDHLHNGVLILNYTGHGGELGWTEEQLFQIDDITNAKNRHTLPLLMTATCEFSRFDNPVHKSAGEYLINQEKGGAIALFTTVRLVFSLPNFKLNKTFYQILRQSINNDQIRLGDVFRLTKVINNGGTNDRNFTLLGDPALKLAFPLFNTPIDSIVENNALTDTLRSLSRPKMYGHIESKQGSFQSNYNGWAEIKIYDKKRSTVTLDNDNNGIVFDYETQEDLLFRGQTKITNGKWEIDFIIPKDIRLNYDLGKISVYTIDSSGNDGSGYSKSYVIGGSSNNITLDNQGPIISVFLEDTSFTFGDEVIPTPLFISHLSDSSGINIMNNDIGKDITLTIDEDFENTIVLNSKYKTDQSTYKKGEIIVPLDEMKNGRHSLTLKAYDNQNNSSQAYTEFLIESNPQIALSRVLNYPNPFTTSTDFYFEHNQSSNELNIQIQIITISGKLIKTITSNLSANSQRIGPIHWDGKDDFGDAIGRGVYIYRVIVENSEGDKIEKLEKLVILK